MLGLVSIDILRLTSFQWAALVLNAVGWMWWCSRDSDRWLLTAVFTFSGLWLAFWHERTSIDQWMLFWQAREMAPLSWQEALDQLPLRSYVRYQTPFVSFWFSRLPMMWVHQVVWFPFAILCAGLMGQLYGRRAALLLATPVCALMIHQPCHDTLLFGALLMVLRLIQMKQRWLAACVYGLTWAIKPLTILTAPFLLPQLGLASLLSVVMWGGYVGWSWQWEFGRRQFRFLLHQLMIRPMHVSSGAAAQQIPLPFSTQVRRVLRKILRTGRWRWDHIGIKAVKALPLYLFPAWLRPWSWKGIMLCGMILLGYGNIKYLLLDLLFLFPVQEETDFYDFQR